MAYQSKKLNHMFSPLARHGHDRIGRKDYGPAGLVLRSIKRRKVLMNLSLKYRWVRMCWRKLYQIPLHANPKENGRQQCRRRVRLFHSWPQMLTTALLALMQCHLFPRRVSWSLLDLMARQILMVCLIFNGFESGATARVITRFALLDLNVVMFTAHVHCSNGIVESMSKDL